MAILAKFGKQPAEVMDFQFDFTDWLADRTDTIVGTPVVTSALVPASPPIADTTPLVIGSVAELGGIVRYFTSGGTDKCKYEITCTFFTNGGRTKQDEVILAVKET